MGWEFVISWEKNRVNMKKNIWIWAIKQKSGKIMDFKMKKIENLVKKKGKLTSL